VVAGRSAFSAVTLVAFVAVVLSRVYRCVRSGSSAYVAPYQVAFGVCSLARAGAAVAGHIKISWRCQTGSIGSRQCAQQGTKRPLTPGTQQQSQQGSRSQARESPTTPLVPGQISLAIERFGRLHIPFAIIDRDRPALRSVHQPTIGDGTWRPKPPGARQLEHLRSNRCTSPKVCCCGRQFN
jgi:hypothetical protein